jgi:subfamily B ATP-binding cassette protein MsbA
MRFVRPHLALIVVVLFLSVTWSAADLAAPFLLKVLIDNVLIAKDFSLFWLVIGLFVVAELVDTAAGVGFTYYQTVISQRLIMSVRRALFEHLESLDLLFHQQAKVGDLLTRFEVDSADINTLITTTSTAFKNVILTIGVFSVTLLLDWQVAVFSLVVFPFYALVTRHYSRRIRAGGMALRVKTAGIFAFVQERLLNIELIKTLHREKYEEDQFADKNLSLIKDTLSYTLFTRLVNALTFYIGYLPTFFVLVYGSYQVMAGELTIGGLVAINAYVASLSIPVSALGGFGLNIAQQRSAVDRVFEILDQQPKVTDREGARDLEKVSGGISIDGVSFRYASGEKVLEDVSFSVQAGKKVAIVGHSGAGKTTIGRLICRFYDPDSGAILLDGVDIRDIKLASLRKHIAMVTEKAPLYNLSVKENIRYGRLDATDEDVVNAAKNAEIHDYISSLEKGYDTMIGELGSRLSGGQKQRMALARMFLKNPDVLILDEATSSIDAPSEERIYKSIDRVLPGKTIIIIAHRLSTIKDVDSIVVLKGSRVVESGTFDELVGKKGDFYELFKSQKADAT